MCVEGEGGAGRKNPNSDPIFFMNPLIRKTLGTTKKNPSHESFFLIFTQQSLDWSSHLVLPSYQLYFNSMLPTSEYPSWIKINLGVILGLLITAECAGQVGREETALATGLRRRQLFTRYGSPPPPPTPHPPTQNHPDVKYQICVITYPSSTHATSVLIIIQW